MILGAYLTGCVAGYASRLALRRLLSPRQVQVEASQALVAEPTKSAARRLARVGADQAPQLPLVVASSSTTIRRPPELPAPRSNKPDNLRLIKGIGAKTESALQDLGIYHFDQIAAWQPAHVAWLEGRIAIKGRIGREQWIEQATLLATAPRSNAA
ncbi:hypothetical protein [Devosia rhizoryzae]|uniref:NADH-quinone oxidoreductase subunit E n=1 Tax=Devosia rhizoryzae TaxID=2774137 RepID=A0ABX7CGA7_9HYPH|nr:hypothetical protein [Devosia rhizoryzae]QQR40946.1 hypothetical protein JI748_08185 [Devosia rhizoryzae]